MITIICKSCGCRRDIKEKEIPIGECNYCIEDFGWTLFPESLKDFKILDGDVITIATIFNKVHPERIFRIERNNEIIWDADRYACQSAN